MHTDVDVDVDGIPDMGRVWSMDLVELTMEAKPFARGAFGHVYKGEYFGTPVCVKILKNEDPNEREHSFKLIQREVTSLKFGHPNLVQFMGAAEKGDKIFIVTEYIHGGNLRQYIKDERVHIPWALRGQIAKDIACGMAYLHSKGIIHRDLKSKNLLVGDNWRIKICDFGFARSVSRRQLMTVCGTGDWMAPEVLQGLDYDEKADVYSFGIVICELITRRKAADDLPRSPVDFSLDTDRLVPLVPEDCPPALLSLAMSCVAWDAHARPAFKDITRSLKNIVASLTPSPTSYPRPSSFSLLSSSTTAPPGSLSGSPPTSHQPFTYNNYSNGNHNYHNHYSNNHNGANLKDRPPVRNPPSVPHRENGHQNGKHFDTSSKHADLHGHHGKHGDHHNGFSYTNGKHVELNGKHTEHNGANGYRLHWPQESDEGTRGFVSVTGGTTAQPITQVVWSDSWDSDKGTHPNNITPLCVSNRLNNSTRKLPAPPNMITPSTKSKHKDKEKDKDKDRVKDKDKDKDKDKTKAKDKDKDRDKNKERENKDSDKDKEKPPSPPPPPPTNTPPPHSFIPLSPSKQAHTESTHPVKLLNTSSHSTRSTNAPHLQVAPLSPRSPRHLQTPPPLPLPPPLATSPTSISPLKLSGGLHKTLSNGSVEYVRR